MDKALTKSRIPICPLCDFSRGRLNVRLKRSHPTFAPRPQRGHIGIRDFCLWLLRNLQSIASDNFAKEGLAYYKDMANQPHNQQGTPTLLLKLYKAKVIDISLNF